MLGKLAVEFGMNEADGVVRGDLDGFFDEVVGEAFARSEGGEKGGCSKGNEVPPGVHLGFAPNRITVFSWRGRGSGIRLQFGRGDVRDGWKKACRLLIWLEMEYLMLA